MTHIHNVLSLFDGMSCCQIALNRAGITYDNYYASEIDKHAIKVTQNNYPKTLQLGNVIKLISDTLPNIDLLAGGSPCTNFSFAGKIKGMVTKDNIEVRSFEQYIDLKNKGYEFEGQSYLFFEYVRLLRELKPKYFLLENVRMKKEWESIITEHLGVEPICINSNLVSAQNRIRLYWTNIPGVVQPENKHIYLKDVLDESIPLDENIIVRDKSKCVRSGGRGSVDRHEWDSIDRNHSRKLSVLECERLQTLPDNYTSCVPDTHRYKMLGNGWTVSVIEHIFKNIK